VLRVESETVTLLAVAVRTIFANLEATIRGGTVLRLSPTKRYVKQRSSADERGIQFRSSRGDTGSSTSLGCFRQVPGGRCNSMQNVEILSSREIQMCIRREGDFHQA
jgi:hypothetical protein